MEVCAGRLADIPERSCVPIADGQAVVVRSGHQISAFTNRCLHQDSPLDGGWVRDGIITCPQHFWRFRVADGCHLGSTGRLTTLPVRIHDGTAWVEVPERPAGSLREQLLVRARQWDRDRAYRATKGEPC